MFLSELRIENLRMFGEGKDALVLPLRCGLVALVGENDSGKTTIIDALRLALGTRDQEFFRLSEADFHQPRDGGKRRNEIRIRCKFVGLSLEDKKNFAEYLSYDVQSTAKTPILYINWKATNITKSAQRRFTNVETRSGQQGDGPQFNAEAKDLLCSTYLRPLRDADRALSAGRGSRLSQILQHTKEVREHGQDYDPQVEVTDPGTLSVLGIGDYASALLAGHEGVKAAQKRLNIDYLKNLSFSGDQLHGAISVSGSKSDPSLRLRQLLEKLELELWDQGVPEPPPSRGLGSNNLLFMACELLVLGSGEDWFPLLLVEEPEAHLHPQRQLLLMQFLQQRVSEPRSDGQTIQIIITTHSPNLASVVDPNDLVLLHGGRAFPMERGRTMLSESDYGFLRRFLDSTKANLFFARGVLIVEGAAENILLPTLARLIGRDLAENGVSIVNVGGTGLRRFARIYQRSNLKQDGTIKIPVACVTDLDVMPDCAPGILGKIKEGEGWPDKNTRHWRAKKDFQHDELKQHRSKLHDKASGQNVRTFVADEWTLEYDLAYCGLAQEVWIAAHLARNDEAIASGHTTGKTVYRDASRSFSELSCQNLSREDLASRVYAMFARNSSASKATAAQYLSYLLEALHRKGRLSAESLRSRLPPYLVGAIEYVTIEAASEEEPTSG